MNHNHMAYFQMWYVAHLILYLSNEFAQHLTDCSKAEYVYKIAKQALVVLSFSLLFDCTICTVINLLIKYGQYTNQYAFINTLITHFLLKIDPHVKISNLPLHVTSDSPTLFLQTAFVFSLSS